MVEKWKNYLEEFRKFIQEKNWQLFSEKEIDHGYQVVVTDGATRLPVNFFHTGKITPQGKPCETKTAITEWANLIQSGLVATSADETPISQNRISKYFVLPENFEKIREIIHSLAGEVLEKDVSGPADVYRIENKLDGNRVTISQFNSGTLMVQGLSSILFDNVCETLDTHLTQSLSERASRYLSGESERNTVTAYLEQPNAENESTQWLLQHLDKKVLNFLYDNDRRTLLAAAGVRNAFKISNGELPDYSVVVMPFAKAFEGFLVKLAIHLDLTSEDILAAKADESVVGTWVNQIKDRIPDPKRYGEIAAGLESAWKCRHKAIHSDAFFTLSVLKTFTDAEHEIITILRAMVRAFVVFFEEGLRLLPPSKKEKETKSPSSTGAHATNSKIGVDESGKGDLFGPLIVAGVITNPETEILLVKRGVRDSKSLSDSTILELAPFIKEHCVIEVLILLPPEYNALYEQHGNLNRLLAWGHAQVISNLSKKQKVSKAISDQFGDESLVINALKAENCEIILEQRPHAESDIAVAAASIIARSEFVISMKDYTTKAEIDIPLGTSASEVKNIGKKIYQRWGKPGLERIAKMHFKTIQEIMSETK